MSLVFRIRIRIHMKNQFCGSALWKNTDLLQNVLTYLRRIRIQDFLDIRVGIFFTLNKLNFFEKGTLCC
jgi:hypothetical protein